MNEKGWETEEEKVEFADRPIRFLIDLRPYRLQQTKKSKLSTHLAVKLPEFYTRWIERIKERAGGIYDIKSDVVRDALWIGLRVLTARYKLPEWRTDIRLMEIANEVEEDNLIKENVSRLMDEVQRLWSTSEERARRHLKAYIDEVKKISDDWRRERHLEELSKYSLVKELGIEDEKG